MMTGYANSNDKKRGVPDLLVATEFGKKRPVYGLYVALSHDEGNTWSYRKLISDNSVAGHEVQAMDGALYTVKHVCYSISFFCRPFLLVFGSVFGSNVARR
jgi:hypothetical protein